jgi:hypothetical protein
MKAKTHRKRGWILSHEFEAQRQRKAPANPNAA